ncbi:MAG: trigger factor [Bacillota bacterium]|nr:trigger factor [Bacillota bacterium]
MSLKSSNKVEANRYQLEIEVDGEAFETAINAAYKKGVNKINVPGFRKGKAPRQMIEKLYGKDVFYEDAMNSLYPEALDSAVNEANLKLVNDKIDLDIVSADENGFVFKATITVEPEVSIDNYKGISVTEKSTEITQEAIDAEILKAKERGSRLITVEDRAAQNGDTAVIDFEGFLDGVPFEGGKAENYNLNLGGGQFIPGFEEQIVGHNANDEFTITVTFPEDYQSEELKGKETEFKIKLHEIKTRELPEFDDEFVKDISDKETVEEYLEQVKEDLKKRLVDESETDKDNQINEKLIELVEAEIPEAMYKNKATDMIRDFEMRLRSQGMDLNTYLNYMGMDEAALQASYLPQAEKSVKLRLALEKIADLEKFEVSEADIENEFSKMAEIYQMEVDKIKSLVQSEDLAKDLKVQKAHDFVKTNAVMN